MRETQAKHCILSQRTFWIFFEQTFVVRYSLIEESLGALWIGSTLILACKLKAITQSQQYLVFLKSKTHCLVRISTEIYPIFRKS